MSRLIIVISSILLFALCISSVLCATRRKGCNFKDVELMDVEIMDISPPMDKRRTYMEIVEKNGKKLVNGTWAFIKDLPLHAEFKWEMYAIEDGNRAVKRGQGLKTTFCSFLVNEKPLADMLLKHSDFPPVCPIKKGTYHINEAAPDPAVIPCFAPGKSNSWELRVKISDSVSRKTIIQSINKYNLVR